MINLIVDEGSLRVFDALSNQGLPMTNSSAVDVPGLPPDITDLDDEDLIRLFQHLNEFTKFIKVQVACAQIDESDAKKKLDMADAKLTSTHTAPKVTVASIKAAVASDPDIIKLTDVYQARHDYRKMIEMMVNNLESDINLVSRELTRRTSGGSFRSRSSKFTT
jgi:molybdopterin-biosynthesis enzyme MoeA-like protein